MGRKQKPPCSASFFRKDASPPNRLDLFRLRARDLGESVQSATSARPLQARVPILPNGRHERQGVLRAGAPAVQGLPAEGTGQTRGAQGLREL